MSTTATVLITIMFLLLLVGIGLIGRAADKMSFTILDLRRDVARLENRDESVSIRVDQWINRHFNLQAEVDQLREDRDTTVDLLAEQETLLDWQITCSEESEVYAERTRERLEATIDRVCGLERRVEWVQVQNEGPEGRLNELEGRVGILADWSVDIEERIDSNMRGTA